MTASPTDQPALPGRSTDVRPLYSLYRMMVRIRAFENAAEAASQGGVSAYGRESDGSAQVRGPLHLSTGQEAVAAGVCAHLRRSDYLTSTHRGHGHTLAKGADATRMMCELFGKKTGYNGGKGGSMHIADFSVGMLGANGVVAAGLPIAVGAAHAQKVRRNRHDAAGDEAGAATARRGEGGDGGKRSGGASTPSGPHDAITVCFFGDGAINRGPFLEALNWAQIHTLPVLFVCEDNRWSATTASGPMIAGEGASARARALGIAALQVDGNDVLAVHEAAAQLIAAVRSGAGPRLLHAITYRMKGHVSVDPAAYRDAREVEAARQTDPIARARAKALAQADADGAALDRIDAEAQQEIAAALAAAAAAPWPDATDAFTDVQTTGAGQWY